MPTDHFREKFSAKAYEPVADHFIGVRVFGRTRNTRGYLTGMAFRSRWSPGVNVAGCYSTLGDALSAIGSMFGGFIAGTDELGEAHGDRHPPPASGCGCGFWAYTLPPEGGPIRLSDGSVLGIIEAWGRMLIGPLGFRAEKARILALAFPAGTAEGVADIVTTRGVEQTYKVRARVARQAWQTPLDPVEMPWVTSHEDAAAIARNYPDVAIFHDEATMLAEFPVSDLAPLLEDGGAA